MFFDVMIYGSTINLELQVKSEKHDRDFNSSKNILKQGLKILSGSGIESDIKQKQVEALSLDESMKPETHLSPIGVDMQFI